MTIRKLKNRLAAAALAAALAFSGAAGVGATTSADHGDGGHEVAGGTWSKSIKPGDPTGGGPQPMGGTWS